MEDKKINMEDAFQELFGHYGEASESGNENNGENCQTQNNESHAEQLIENHFAEMESKQMSAKQQNQPDMSWLFDSTHDKFITNVRRLQKPELRLNEIEKPYEKM